MGLFVFLAHYSVKWMHGLIKLSGKTIGALLIGLIGAVMLGVGMCLTMVVGNMVVGIIVGIVGIVVLLSLIPFIKGLQE